MYYYCTYGIAFPDPPLVGAPRVLEFRRNSVIVLIEWIQSQRHRHDTTYSVDVVPHDLVLVHNIITLNSSMSAQLQLSYNTSYNVSITAATLCVLWNATKIVSLDFGESSGDL